MPITMDDIRELSVDERIDLMDLIWDSIAAEPGGMEISDDFKRELDRRLDSMRDSPDDEVSWEEAKRRILSGECGTK